MSDLADIDRVALEPPISHPRPMNSCGTSSRTGRRRCRSRGTRISSIGCSQTPARPRRAPRPRAGHGTRPVRRVPRRRHRCRARGASDVQADSDLNNRIREAGRSSVMISVPRGRAQRGGGIPSQQYEARIGPVPATVADALSPPAAGHRVAAVLGSPPPVTSKPVFGLSVPSMATPTTPQGSNRILSTPRPGGSRTSGLSARPRATCPRRPRPSTLDFMDRFRKRLPRGPGPRAGLAIRAALSRPHPPPAGRAAVQTGPAAWRRLARVPMVSCARKLVSPVPARADLVVLARGGHAGADHERDQRAVPEPPRRRRARPAGQHGDRPAAAAEQPALGLHPGRAAPAHASPRRAYEYDHHYGLRARGQGGARPAARPTAGRSSSRRSTTCCSSAPRLLQAGRRHDGRSPTASRC